MARKPIDLEWTTAYPLPAWARGGGKTLENRPMLSLWLLLTLLASLASATTPSPSRHKLAFYLGVGLLLGPGVLGLSRVLERRPAKTPWERYHRQLVQLLAVLLVVPPFALIHGIWAFSLATSSPFLELWQATSLALPLPTLCTQRLFQWTRDYGNCWIPFALFGPAWATRSLLGCGYGTPLVENSGGVVTSSTCSTLVGAAFCRRKHSSAGRPRTLRGRDNTGNNSKVPCWD